MKKILLLIFCIYAGNASAQIFSQSFNDGNSVSTYRTTNGAPEPNKFTTYTNFANAPVSIINSFLRWDKKGSSAACVVRNHAMVTPAPTFMKLQFRIRFLAPTTFNNYTNKDVDFYIGDDTGPTTWPVFSTADAPDPAAVHTKFSIKLHMVETPASQQFSIGDPSTKYSDFKTITVFSNNTGVTKNYWAPDGTFTSVANNAFDVWVEGDNVINEGAAVTPGVALNKFKFLCPADAPNAIIQMDDFLIYDDNVLPVAFTSFNAKQDGAAVRLNWSTASETNNSHFEILRAGDQTDFQVIATVKGKGNSDQKSDYMFTDPSPLNGNNYYKLRQVDFDGKTANHPSTLQVNVGMNKQSLYVSTDQYKSQLNIHLQSTKQYRDQLQIVDMNGRVLLTKEVYVNTGQNLFQLSNFLNNGLYIVRLKESGHKVKFIKSNS